MTISMQNKITSFCKNPRVNSAIKTCLSYKKKLIVIFIITIPNDPIYRSA